MDSDTKEVLAASYLGPVVSGYLADADQAELRAATMELAAVRLRDLARHLETPWRADAEQGATLRLIAKRRIELERSAKYERSIASVYRIDAGICSRLISDLRGERLFPADEVVASARAAAPFSPAAPAPVPERQGVLL